MTTNQSIKKEIKRMEEKILNEPSPTHYIKTTKTLVFREFGSRRTSIEKGDIGFLLDEEHIYKLSGASSKEKAKMIHKMMQCYDQGGAYALVCGRPCFLMPDEFENLNYVPNVCCGELI